MRRFGTVVFSLLLLAPLASAPGFGTEALRLVAVLGLLALLLGGSALHAVRRRERSRRSDPLLTAAFLFLGANLLSLAAAPPAWEAAVSLAVQAAGVAAYAFARGGALPRSYVLDTGLWVVAGLGLAVAALGIVQWLGGVPAVSAEGNTNYSGTLAAMLLPAAVAGALFTGVPAWKRALSVSAAVALFVLLLATESRGGLVGAVTGCGAMGVALAARRMTRAASVAAAVAAMLVVVPLLFLGRRHLSAPRAETARVRLGIWKGALAMAADRPWLGTGVGGFAARFPPYRDAEECLLSNRDAGPDFREVEDAHSIWMQIAAETGLPGLLAFLLVLYVATRLWRYYLRTAPDTGAAAALAGLGGGVAAYLVAGFFNALHLRVSHTLLFWAFLGLVELVGNGRVRWRHAPARPSAAALPVAWTLLALLGTGMAGMLAWMDRQFQAGMRTAAAPERAARFEEALHVHPPYWPMRYELARALVVMGSLREGVAAYRAVLDLRPHHAAALNNLAVALLQTPEGEAEAERRLRDAIAGMPYYALSHYNLGVLEARRRRLPEARALFEEALRRNPRHAHSSYCLGVTYLLEGDAPRALDHFRRARGLGFDVASALRQEHPSAASDPLFADMTK